MTPVGSINPLSAAQLGGIDAPMPKTAVAPAGLQQGAPSDGFGKVLDGLIATVDGKQATAQQLTRQVLLGDSGQLHQSVIAMQEASVAFSMMVEVRNKLVESYQELMRMQV
ncbi:MAG: flagellar hook-basal body complex subunit FliE [Verrucomicrobia bacterium]|nr:flagellar hook-basal body complex subunit FliE [Verrucomicrobiota bacterium]